MAAMKSVASLPSMSRTAFVLLIVALAAQSQVGRSQNCSDGLAALMTCAPYVVPGYTEGPPSPQCCSSLKAINRTCLCNTINIIARLPIGCNLPQVTCAA